jgi:hypothetical protein
MLSRSLVSMLLVATVLSACDPIVESREFRYSAVVRIGGQEQTLSGSYGCYLDGEFLDGRGPGWGFARHKPLAGDGFDLALRGKVGNSLIFEIHPTLEAALRLGPSPLNEGFCAIPRQADLESVLFYKRPGETVYHSSSALDAENMESTDIILESAKRQLLRQGHALHGEHKGDDTPTTKYYSVIPYIMTSKMIDEAGMREYLKKMPTLWLRPGAVLPLDPTTARQIAGFGFPYAEALRRFRGTTDWRPTAPMTLSRESLWQAGRVRDWVKMDAEHANMIWDSSRLIERSVWPPPTTWVNYKGCRVEIPLLYAQSRHVYDPEEDQLVIFEPEFADLSSD